MVDVMVEGYWTWSSGIGNSDTTSFSLLIHMQYDHISQGASGEWHPAFPFLDPYAATLTCALLNFLNEHDSETQMPCPNPQKFV